MEFLKFPKKYLLLLALGLTACNGQILEKLSDGPSSTNFCPTSRLANGQCPEKNISLTWDFSRSEEYDFIDKYVEVSSGKARLKEIDQFFSDSDFIGGTFLNTKIMGNRLTIDDSNVSQDFNSSWTPRFSKLVLNLKMDNSWEDATSYAHHATSSGGVSFSSESKIGSHAAEFDTSATGLLTISDHDDFDGGQKFSMSVWVKPEGCSNTLWGAIFAKRAGYEDNHSYALYNLGCTLYVDVDGALDRFAVNEPLDDHTWQHIVLVFDGSLTATDRVKLYKNGRLIETAYESSSAIPNYVSDLYIGMAPASGLDSFEGLIDDFALWRDALNWEEIVLIYERQRQRHSGQYESPVLDLGPLNANWTQFNVKTPLPFMKEIPGSPALESISDYQEISTQLKTDLIALWHLNETNFNSGPSGSDFEDFSGANNHLNQEIGIVAQGLEGKFGNSINFDGSNDALSAVDSATLSMSANLSIQAWVYQNKVQSGYATIVGKTSTGDRVSYALNFSSDGLSLRFFVGSDVLHDYEYVSTAAPSINEWHHIVGVATSTHLILYIDGAEVARIPRTITTIGNSVAPVCVGGLTGAVGNDCEVSLFSGRLDEIAIWARDLSESEVIQLYRRGANRVKYQVRSCIDSSCSCRAFNIIPAGSIQDCDGDGILNEDDSEDSYRAHWVGPGGDGTTYYSELLNRANTDLSFTCNLNTSDYNNDICVDDEIAFSGTANTTSGEFKYGEMAPSALIDDNRYFQYRVLMQADENSLCTAQACLPEIASFKVLPSGRYYGGITTIENKKAFSYEVLSNLSITKSGSCPLSYQLSNDGSHFYYWNGNRWSLSNEILWSESSSLSTINTHIADLPSGELFWRILISSDGTQMCELDKVEIGL